MSARWYSKYDMDIKDKQLSEENLLNASRYKEELKDVIDKEDHRQNVDRAKKKSVTQHMDYDNFHQMVLGADLKGLKSKEITNLKPCTNLLNTNYIHKDLVKGKDVQANNYAIDLAEEETINKLKQLYIGIKEEFTISIFEKECKNTKDMNTRLE